MTEIIEVNTVNHQQTRQFLSLPHRLYADVPQWVPPLEIDARQTINRQKNPFFLHSEAVFLLAVDGNQNVVGRLAVLENTRFNLYQSSKTAFFYLFECINNISTAQQLFEKGFEWSVRRGLTKIIGPKGFTVFDGAGLLVKGFEHRPAFGLPYNLPYYPDLIEACGFKPTRDLLSGYMDYNVQFPDHIHKVADLLKKRRGFTVTSYKSRKDLKTLVHRLKELYNSSLGGTEDNVPLTDEEVNTLANQMLWFANPRLIKVVMKDGEPIGFLFAYPDISAALIRCRGRLFPFGWLDLLLEMRRTKWININGAGMIEKYRGLGGTALLFSEMAKSLLEEEYLYADVVQIGTENDKMLREIRELGIDFYKTHRLYERDLP